MKKTVLVMALGVLFVMVSFALALDDPNSAVRPERLDYYNQVEQAKSLYLDGGQLSHEQETILISEGIIPAPENELDETGGPDEFGYMFWDSQEVGGPVYSWIDISATGTVTTGWNADITQGPYDIGFDFSFYGVDYDQFYMCSHGWLSFSADQGVTWTNSTLPNPSSPNNIVAIMWDDHIIEWFENMYYEVVDDGSLVIQIDQKYQAILFPNSDILLQYHEDYTGVNGSFTGETIGIENADGSVGLQVSYNADPVAYPFGGLAILFTLDEEPEEVTLTLEAWDPPVVIPPTGNYFRFDATVDNATGETLFYDAWANVIYPNGYAPDYPLKLYLGCELAPFSSVTISPWQCVPPCAGECPGIYQFVAKIGTYPDEIIASDVIEVEVLPGDNVGGDYNDITGWVLEGWFGDEIEGEFSASVVVPDEFAIENIYPNPFNPTTNVAVALPNAADLQVSVYNVVGQVVAVLADGRFSQGYHNLTFDASDLSSGIYFVHASVPGKMSEMRKVVLMK